MLPTEHRHLMPESLVTQLHALAVLNREDAARRMRLGATVPELTLSQQPPSLLALACAHSHASSPGFPQRRDQREQQSHRPRSPLWQPRRAARPRSPPPTQLNASGSDVAARAIRAAREQRGLAAQHAMQDGAHATSFLSGEGLRPRAPGGDAEGIPLTRYELERCVPTREGAVSAVHGRRLAGGKSVPAHSPEHQPLPVRALLGTPSEGRRSFASRANIHESSSAAGHGGKAAVRGDRRFTGRYVPDPSLVVRDPWRLSEEDLERRAAEEARREEMASVRRAAAVGGMFDTL